MISVKVNNSVVQKRKGVGHCCFIRGCQAIVNVETSEGKDERFWDLRNMV